MQCRKRGVASNNVTIERNSSHKDSEDSAWKDRMKNKDNRKEGHKQATYPMTAISAVGQA